MLNSKQGFVGGAILFVLALALIGGGYHVYNKQSQDKSSVEEKASIPTNTLTFEDSLKDCLKYSDTYVHPFTQETMKREVLGVIDGKCRYVEQMPNGGKMECKYSEEERKSVAQHYRDAAVAESAGVSINANLGGGQKTTYTMNGKAVTNPVQAAMDSGVCNVSGF